ncbi:MAG: hypothetical protein ABIO70_11380 [Pseudomonadota bacterium]
MEFDWMEYDLPAVILARNAASRVRQQREGARFRARLLRRLGYDQAYATHRVLGDAAWACELLPGGGIASEDELRAAVAEAFSR